MQEKGKYKFIFIINLSSNLQEVKQYIDKLLDSYSINILERNELNAQKLVYPIQKQRKAFYYILNVEYNEDKNNILRQVKNDLRLNESIFRFLNFSIPKPKKKIKILKKKSYDYKRDDYEQQKDFKDTKDKVVESGTSDGHDNLLKKEKTSPSLEEPKLEKEDKKLVFES